MEGVERGGVGGGGGGGVGGGGGGGVDGSTGRVEGRRGWRGGGVEMVGSRGGVEGAEGRRGGGDGEGLDYVMARVAIAHWPDPLGVRLDGHLELALATAALPMPSGEATLNDSALRGWLSVWSLAYPRLASAQPRATAGSAGAGPTCSRARLSANSSRSRPAELLHLAEPLLPMSRSSSYQTFSWSWSRAARRIR